MNIAKHFVVVNHPAAHLGHHNAAQATCQTANADDRRDRFLREHVGYRGENVARPRLMRRRAHPDQ
ncbi:hypothetical protein D3C86_2080850 [compost metagenome]